jgi:hypothetical protein
VSRPSGTVGRVKVKKLPLVVLALPLTVRQGDGLIEKLWGVMPDWVEVRWPNARFG